MTPPLRVVMDTSVLVAAVRSTTGASSRFLDLVEQGIFRLSFTTALLLEYEAVLLRTEQVQQHRLSAQSVNRLLDRLMVSAAPVRIRYRYRPLLTDPDDEHVLEAAVNGFADALVTHNVSDFLPAALQFGIQVVRPADIIHLGRLQ